MTTIQSSIRCKQCQKILKEEEEPCLKCGGHLRMFYTEITENITLKDNIEYKKYSQGIKRFLLHVKRGWFNSGDKKNHPEGVILHQEVNRENNFYKKKVEDYLTGEITKDLEEPLNKHLPKSK